MLRIVLYSIFTILLISTQAQLKEETRNLVKEGIQYHDEGDYAKAITAYKKALKIEPNSGLVHYEIAMSYMYSGDCNKAVKHSDKVLESGDARIEVQAIVTKGSCLNDLGKRKEGIKLLEKAKKKYPKEYLIPYNLGVNYMEEGDLQKCSENMVEGININPNHASSHLMLAYAQADLGNRVKSIYALHFFLLLEPNSKRAENAYELLMKLNSAGVEKTSENETTIHIGGGDDNEDGFMAAELMLALMAVSDDAVKEALEKEGLELTNENRFMENTKNFFETVAGLRDEKKSEGIWWELYVPFYEELIATEHFGTYCHFISQIGNEKSRDWLDTNGDKLDALSAYLSE